MLINVLVLTLVLLIESNLRIMMNQILVYSDVFLIV